MLNLLKGNKSSEVDVNNKDDVVISQSTSFYSSGDKITTIYVIIALAIITGYIIFFTSPYWLGGVDKENVAITQIGEPVEDMLGKKFTVENWEYCKASQEMILEVSIENLVFDGINEYQYYGDAKITSGEVKECTSEIVYKENGFNVIKISDIPKEMQVMTVTVAYESNVDVEGNELETPALYGAYLCTSKEAVTKKDKIKILDKKGYKISSLERIIKNNEMEINELNAEISKQEKSQKEILNTIEIYCTSKENTIQDEQSKIDKKIQECETHYESISSLILDCKARISELEESIEQAKSNIDILQGKEKATEKVNRIEDENISDEDTEKYTEKYTEQYESKS